MNISQHFLDSYVNVMQTIEHFATQCGRSAVAVRLMAVSKNVSIENIMGIYSAGQRIFGENRVQEAEKKFTPEVLALMPEIQLHCIGTVQSNKIKKVLKLFSCIQSVASLQLLIGLAKVSKTMPIEIIKTRDFFLQVNPLGDPKKSGFCDYNSLLTAFRYARKCKTLSSVFHVSGLMTIAPFYKNDGIRTRDDTKKAFATTRLWKEQLEYDMQYDYNLDLSMGMSNDFDCAIREHSTMVRLGSALFGKRI